ncbi:MAG: FkbM family methyltransferase [Bacteroidales bacterium]|nr:FkbM family methyltransferase [Bacteroidales bacterium]
MGLIEKLKNFYLSIKNREITKIVNRGFVKANVTRCGSQCGGFDVVLPSERVAREGVALSFGVGEDLSFSEDLHRLCGIIIFAFDPTPRSVEYVKNHPFYYDLGFGFYDVGISDRNEEAEFHLPVNSEHVSGSMERYDGVREDSIKVQMKSFATICRDLGVSSVDILKMDIEGSEFKVIPDIIKSGIEVSQLCIETHERFFPDKKEKFAALFDLLYSNGYKCVSKNYVESVYTFVKGSMLE